MSYSFSVDEKNTKSPAFKLFLLTVLPTLTCSVEVLGRFTLAAFLYTYDVSPEQSNELGPLAPHEYGFPNCLCAKSTTFLIYLILDYCYHFVFVHTFHLPSLLGRLLALFYTNHCCFFLIPQQHH